MLTRRVFALVIIVSMAAIGLSQVRQVLASDPPKKGPCQSAYVDDPNTCAGRSQIMCFGTHYETAIPGRCLGQFTSSTNCREDGVTFVTVNELQCVWNSTYLICDTNETGNSQLVQISNCY